MPAPDGKFPENRRGKHVSDLRQARCAKIEHQPPRSRTRVGSIFTANDPGSGYLSGWFTGGDWIWSRHWQLILARDLVGDAKPGEDRCLAETGAVILIARRLPVGRGFACRYDAGATGR